MNQITESTPLPEIVDALIEDGYQELTPRAAEIRNAIAHGACVWTERRLRTTDASQIDARPVS